MVSVEFDSEVNAVYIHLKKGKVDSSEPLADNVIVDVNEKEAAIGIEIILPGQDLKIKEFVSKAFKTGA